MKQLTFASATYADTKKTTESKRFLTQMAQVVPWAELQRVIELYYPNEQPRGRSSHLSQSRAHGIE